MPERTTHPFGVIEGGKRRRPFSGARTTGGGVPDWLPGWVFAAVTVAPTLLALAWLVPGTGMLLAGRLLPLPMVIIFVPLAVALATSRCASCR